jgi:LmbE family N-acetylglucosaminyl deacetylase
VSATSVVLFHAHPDDEAIFTGGTIAHLADLGCRVTVVIATCGELGELHHGEAAASLGDHRADETRDACRLLGAARVEFLGYRDSGLPGDPANHALDAFARASLDEAAERLAAVLREERPDALVVYDDGGIYGHPDHVQVHHVGMRAAALAGVDTLYEATVDREYLHFVETHLVADALASFGGEVPLGVPTVVVTTMVDVRQVLDRKRAAIAAHQSQIPADTRILTMDAETFAAVYGYEWYIRTGPPAALDDLPSAGWW